MKMKIRNVRLRIRYKRRSDLVALVALLALALATAAFLTTLAWGQEEVASAAQASPAAFTGMRKYYLAKTEVDGDEAHTACAPGYHMASLWEILDPSNLEYNSDLGVIRADSGAGPPLGWGGWVRTGWDSEGSTDIPGQDNCEAWTSGSSLFKGAIAWLPADWTAGEEDMHVWIVEAMPCGASPFVWCVEDSDFSVHLPLVLKD